MIILADATNESGGKLNILGAGISRITPAALPSVLPQIAVVVRASLAEGDYDRTHQLSIEMVGPNGAQVVPPLESTVLPEMLRPMRDSLLNGEQEAVNMTFLMQGLTFSEEGIYQFVVRLDDQELRYPVVLRVMPLESPAGLVLPPPG